MYVTFEGHGPIRNVLDNSTLTERQFSCWRLFYLLWNEFTLNCFKCGYLRDWDIFSYRSRFKVKKEKKSVELTARLKSITHEPFSSKEFSRFEHDFCTHTDKSFSSFSSGAFDIFHPHLFSLDGHKKKSFPCLISSKFSYFRSIFHLFKVGKWGKTPTSLSFMDIVQDLVCYAPRNVKRRSN